MRTLSARKLIVVVLLGAVLLLANYYQVGLWLDQHHLLSAACRLREEFVTGTAVTVIVVMLFLIMPPKERS